MNGLTPHRELIWVPQEVRGQVISQCPVSTRLKHILERKGFRLLGDLHGIPFNEFLRFRNCGRKTLAELRQLVHTVQRGHHPNAAPAAREALPSVVRRSRFFVPTSAQELSPFDLPLSVRLEAALRKKGITCLGDLHGVSVKELLRLRNCGRRTIKELVRLIERAATGEFHPRSEAFSPSHIGDLLRALDDRLAELPAREREILLLRLGAKDNRVWTLEEVAAKFNLTRERIRQVAEKTLSFVRRAGGPRLAKQLRGLAVVCTEVGRPLTADLLLDWLGRTPTADRLPLSFYIRLLRELDPNVGKVAIVADGSFVERVIRRSEAPLAFGRLCGILDIPSEGPFAESLWQTCSSIRNVFRIPAEGSDTVLLVHRSCTLEEALVATARAANRPMTVYEFRCAMRDLFGPLFAQRPSAAIRRGLERSRKFLRNRHDAFMLDIHVDQLGLETDNIRRSCLAILSLSNEIVGCDDLIERLEATGKAWENLSDDILGALLRKDDVFQEVGRNRFRVRPCNR